MSESKSPDRNEKITKRIQVACRPSELSFWQAIFGRGELSRKVRELLNREAEKQHKKQSV